MYAVIEEHLADRKSMSDPVSRIALLTTDRVEALRKAGYLADKYGLLRDVKSFTWWDIDEGFTTVHIQEI